MINSLQTLLLLPLYLCAFFELFAMTWPIQRQKDTQTASSFENEAIVNDKLIQYNFYINSITVFLVSIDRLNLTGVEYF